MLPWDSYTSSILNVQATHSPGYGFTSHRVVPYGRPPMLLGESLRPTAVTQDQLTVRGIRASGSGSGSACAGRSVLRGQGVRRLLARTADRAPATAGTTHQTLYIPSSAVRNHRSDPETVAGPRTFTKIAHRFPIPLFRYRSIQTMPSYCYYGRFIFPWHSSPGRIGTLAILCFGFPRFQDAPLEPAGRSGSCDPFKAAVKLSGYPVRFLSVLLPFGPTIQRTSCDMLKVG
jgi:hypothetical protein